MAVTARPSASTSASTAGGERNASTEPCSGLKPRLTCLRLGAGVRLTSLSRRGLKWERSASAQWCAESLPSFDWNEELAMHSTYPLLRRCIGMRRCASSYTSGS